MVTYIKHAPLGDTRYIEIACVSSDTKPTSDVATGSICLEVDTGKIYAFNEANSEWVEQRGGGSSPSAVETIGGTVAEPFGDYSVSDLAGGIVGDDCTVYMQVDASAVGQGTLKFPLFATEDYFLYGMLANPTGDSIDAGFVSWANDTLNSFLMYSSNTLVDLSQYASVMATTVTLITHPI